MTPFLRILKWNNKTLIFFFRNVSFYQQIFWYFFKYLIHYKSTKFYNILNFVTFDVVLLRIAQLFHNCSQHICIQCIIVCYYLCKGKFLYIYISFAGFYFNRRQILSKTIMKLIQFIFIHFHDYQSIIALKTITSSQDSCYDILIRYLESGITILCYFYT